MTSHKAPFKITRPLFFLGMASFLTDAASEMVYPLLPIFLTTVVGASFMFVGLVEGVAESTAAFAKYAFGWWSDRTKKRTRYVIGGYTLANTIRPLIGLAATPGQVLGLRFVDRLGKGMRTAPRDAWLAGMIAPDARGRAYGFHRAMDHAGAMIGPLIASVFLFVYPNQLRSLFLWSIVPGLTAVVFIWWARQAARATPPPPIPVPEMPGPFLSVPLKRYMAILLVFTLGGSSDAFLLLKLSTSGVDSRVIPLLWSGLHVVKSSMSFVGGFLADRIGRTRCIVLGWLWYAVVYLAFGLTSSTAFVVAIFLGYGFYYALTESAERALVSELVPAHARGRAFGLQNLIEGLGMLPASLLFGYLWKAHSPFLAFAVSAVFSAAAAVLLAVFVKEPRSA